MAKPFSVIDLRPMVARERHALIFRELDRLEVGDTLTLINDHDPKPLYYQLQAERPDVFAWDSQPTSDEEWHIQVQRLKSCEPLSAAGLPEQLPHLSPKTPLRFLVSKRPQVITLLAELGIQIPQEGRDSIEVVAKAHQLDVETVMAALERGLAR